MTGLVERPGDRTLKALEIAAHDGAFRGLTHVVSTSRGSLATRVSRRLVRLLRGPMSSGARATGW